MAGRKALLMAGCQNRVALERDRHNNVWSRGSTLQVHLPSQDKRPGNLYDLPLSPSNPQARSRHDISNLEIPGRHGSRVEYRCIRGNSSRLEPVDNSPRQPLVADEENRFCFHLHEHLMSHPYQVRPSLSILLRIPNQSARILSQYSTHDLLAKCRLRTRSKPHESDLRLGSMSKQC